jgi:hypothetical protein
VPGDLLLLAAGPRSTVARALDRVRQFLAREVLGLVPPLGASRCAWGDLGFMRWEAIRLQARSPGGLAPPQGPLRVRGERSRWQVWA